MRLNLGHGTHRHTHRLAEIAGVLARHGWGYLLRQLDLLRYLPKASRDALEPKAGYPLPEVITAILTDMGPSFVKAGQLLSTRADLLPRAYVEALERLQEAGPPVPSSVIREIIADELGAPPEELFQHFVDEPLASASIAQVHRARLFDGAEVIVKVQRPGIRDTIETDVEIATRLARLLEERSPAGRDYNLVSTVVALGEMLRGELDFTREYRNADRMRVNLSGMPFVHIPACHWHLTTARVLTEDYVGGIRVSATEELDAQEYPRRDIAHKIAECALHQIYVDGFFHGDLHPGNVRVLDPQRIGLIDFGIAGELSRSDQRELVTALLCFLNNDPDGFTTHILRLARENPALDTRGLRSDFQDLLQAAREKPGADQSIGEVLRETMSVIFKHRLQLPPWFGLLVKTYVATEGICKRLDPSFDYVEVARRTAVEAMKPHMRLADFLPGLWTGMQEMNELVRFLPGRLNRLLEQISRGELSADVKHEGLDDLVSALQKSSNRIASGIIVAGLILASAILVQADVGPWYQGLSVIGLIGFFVAAILGGWVMVDIFKSGKLKR